jgi:hypothetical protein
VKAPVLFPDFIEKALKVVKVKVRAFLHQKLEQVLLSVVISLQVLKLLDDYLTVHGSGFVNIFRHEKTQALHYLKKHFVLG